MVAPWTTTAKSVSLSGQTGQPHASSPSPGFVPAPLRSSISFSPATLYAALAKTTALGSANAMLMAALNFSDQALIEAIVDDIGADFLFTGDAAHLGSDLRKALIGRIGAALCHIYMDQLGYAWLDYANQHISTTSPLADFLYDGASLGSTGLALAEAKGALSASASAGQVRSKADSAYLRQVSPHLGAMTAAGRIEYGCAIATAVLPASAWLSGNPSCFLHVTETVLTPARSVSGPASSAGSGDDVDLVSVNCLLALRNYRAVFRLIGAPHMVDLLDRLLSRLPLDGVVVQRFGRLATEGDSRWIIGDVNGHPSARDYAHASRLVTGSAFALHERSFKAVMELVKRCADNREELAQDVKLPNLALGRSREHSRDQRWRDRDSKDDSLQALFGDGLAVVDRRGARFSDEENFVWPV